MSLVRLRSNPISYAAGRQAFQLNFLPRRGPRNGRMVVEKIWVEFSGTVTTPGGVTVVPRDIPTLFKLLEVRDAAGVRRNFTGVQAWIMGQHYLERRMPDLPATIPAAAGTAVTIRVPILFRYDAHAFDLRDYCMPVDDLLDGGLVAITMPAVSDIASTGGAITSITAATYQLIVECREDTDVQLYCRDAVDFINQSAAAALDLPVLDNALIDLFLHIAGTVGGGAVVTTVTDCTVPAYRIDALTRSQLKELYLAEHDAPRVLADGYVYNDVALPIITSQRDAKWKDHFRVEGSLIGRFTTSAAVGQFLFRYMTPKDPKIMGNTLAANNLGRDAVPKVKTAGKSAASVGPWGALGAMARWKLGRSA